jgi:hypothetical protein
MQPRQQEMLTKMRDILGDNFTTLRIVSYHLQEDFETDISRITCKLVDESRKDQPVTTIEGQGHGIVDSCFHAMLGALEAQYPSLSTISFKDFSVRGLMATRGERSGADAKAEVTLTVASSEGYDFDFTATSRSLGRAAIDATVQALNYFVNSEKAFIQIYRSLQHYRSTGRPDLVTKYQLLLGEMVQNTSYTQVIDQIRAQELKPR